MAALPEYEAMAEERQERWLGLRSHVCACGGKSGAESAAHEEGVRADMERARAEDADMLVAVEGGGSLMHMTAWKGRTEGLVRGVWECCGERAPLLMRYRNFCGWDVLFFLAMNPNMTRGMYAVFAEHCTNDDLRAADNNGWTVLFHMAVTFVDHANTEEQEENVASVMCAVVQRLGPGALLVETTRGNYYVKKYPAGSTPRSILHDAGNKGRALLQRLEEASAHLEAEEA